MFLSCPELRAEIEKLRVQTGSGSEDVVSASLVEISSLKQKLNEKEREMAEITRYVPPLLVHSTVLPVIIKVSVGC